MKGRTLLLGGGWGVILSFLVCACGPGYVYETNLETQESLGCRPDDPNALRFSQAVCLCGDLDRVGAGLTSSGLSSGGGERKAHVGINGDARSIGMLEIDGDLDVAGSMDATAWVAIRRGLFVGRDLVHRGHFRVDTDAYLGGDLRGRGGLEVEGLLQVAGDVLMRGKLSCGRLVTGVPFPTHTPCPCSPDDLLDVAAEVAANRDSQPAGVSSSPGRVEMVLNGGDYYLADGSALDGSVGIRVEASSRLFVEGDIQMIGNNFVQVEDGAELDIYVSGAVHKIGNLRAGWAESGSTSRSVRLYIGGSDSVALEASGNTRFSGAVYAPRADILFGGNLIVEGALFARSLVGKGHLQVRYESGLVGGDCGVP